MSVGVSPFEVAAAAGAEGLRAVGVAHLKAERMAGKTVAVDIDEAGPLRVRFPRIAAPGVLEAVMVNTGGGTLGGDRLDYAIDVGERAALALTTQASEKVYRSGGAEAQVSVKLRAAKHARLAWLPQETILFDRSRIRRTIEAEVAPNASLTVCESVVFGRAAMGETVASATLRDSWRVRRDGKLVFADVLTLDGDIGGVLARPALGGGATAAGTILQVSPDAEHKIDAVRAALEQDGVEAGASTHDGMLVVRILAADSIGLRAAILTSLSALGAEPPRAFSL